MALVRNKQQMMVGRLETLVVVVLWAAVTGVRKMLDYWRDIGREAVLVSEAVMRRMREVVIKDDHRTDHPLRRNHRLRLLRIRLTSPSSLQIRHSSVEMSELLAWPLSLPTMAYWFQ